MKYISIFLILVCSIVADSSQKIFDLLQEGRSLSSSKQEAQNKFRAVIDLANQELQNREIGNEQKMRFAALKAEALFELHDVEGALKSVDVAISFMPGNAYLFVMKSDIYFATQRHKEAIKQLQIALSMTQHPEPRYKLARVYYLLGKNEDAKEYLEQVLERDPGHVNALKIKAKIAPDFTTSLLLAYHYKDTGDLVQATQYAKEVFSEQPENAACLSLIAGIRIKQRKYDEAVFYAKKLIETHPDISGGYIQAGIALCLLEKYQEAVPMFEKVYELGDFWLGLKYLSRCNLALGNIEKSIEYHEELVHSYNEKSQEHYYKRDVFAVGDYKIMCYYFFNLTNQPDIPRRYSFRVYKKEKFLQEIALTYPEHLHGVMKALGKQEQSYVLEVYHPDYHETYQFFNDEPSYFEVKKLALAILQGKKNPLSKTTYKK